MQTGCPLKRQHQKRLLLRKRRPLPLHLHLARVERKRRPNRPLQEIVSVNSYSFQMWRGLPITSTHARFVGRSCMSDSNTWKPTAYRLNMHCLSKENRTHVFYWTNRKKPVQVLLDHPGACRSCLQDSTNQCLIRPLSQWWLCGIDA